MLLSLYLKPGLLDGSNSVSLNDFAPKVREMKERRVSEAKWAQTKFKQKTICFLILKICFFLEIIRVSLKRFARYVCFRKFQALCASDRRDEVGD